MNKERLSRFSAPLRNTVSTAVLVIAAAAFLPVCGDSGDNGDVRKNDNDRTPSQPVATLASKTPETLETAIPTATEIPALATETFRKVPSKEEIAQLLEQGFAASQPLQEILHQSLKSVLLSLDVCGTQYGEPIELYDYMGKGYQPKLRRVVNVGDSDYLDVMLRGCQEVCMTITHMHEVTGNDKFRQASQLFQGLYDSVVMKAISPEFLQNALKSGRENCLIK